MPWLGFDPLSVALDDAGDSKQSAFA
jgi:hypothetical protein